MTGNIKKAAALLAAGILLCGLIACRGEDSIQIVQNKEKEPEYLSFFSSDSYADSDIAKYWIDQFAEQYEERVYVNHEGAAYYAEEGLSYRELLEKRLESSAPDDLYIINAEDVIEFHKKGYWMDLSGLDFVKNLSAAALSQSTYDGMVFSVPLSFTGFGFCWNVTLLKEHGLTVPGNRSEFLEVCARLKADGILPYGANKGYALTVPAMATGLAGLYQSADKQKRLADLNDGTTAISVYMKEGFEFLSGLIENGFLDPQQAMAAEPRKGDKELFLSGGCAFICMDLCAASQIADTETMEIRFTGLPLLEDGCIAVYGANSRLCVNPESAHLDTALRFIEMVGTKKSLDESAMLEHAMSSAKDSGMQLDSRQRDMCELLQQDGQIPNQDFELHFNTWENIRNVGREICGGIGAEEACRKLDELQRTEIAAYAGNG